MKLEKMNKTELIEEIRALNMELNKSELIKQVKFLKKELDRDKRKEVFFFVDYALNNPHNTLTSSERIAVLKAATLYDRNLTGFETVKEFVRTNLCQILNYKGDFS